MHSNSPSPCCCEALTPALLLSFITACFFQPWAQHPVQGGIGGPRRLSYSTPAPECLSQPLASPHPPSAPVRSATPFPLSDGLPFPLQLQNSWEGQSHRALEIDGTVLDKALPFACVLSLCIPALGPPGHPMQTPVWKVEAGLVRSQYSA